MTLYEITLRKIVHRNSIRIALEFDYNYALIQEVKKIEGASWSRTLKCWYVDDRKGMPEKIRKVLAGKAIINEKLSDSRINKKGLIKNRDLTEETKKYIASYEKFLRGKRYSESTVKTYSTFIADFLNYHNNKEVSHFNNRDVELFCENFLAPNQYSVSTQRQFISALKLLTQFSPEVKIEELQLKRPRKSRILPTVLSKEEVLQLLVSTRNLKHRAALTMMYSAGLRISELLNLRLSDINIERRQVFIHMAKGRKDRVVILAESFIPMFRNYLISYTPRHYFIEGAGGKAYSAGSVRAVIKRSALKAGISKRVTPHTLRHSYATHLLESGIDIRYIQELLGHQRPETTMIYTHVSRKDLLSITSPLDGAIKEVIERDKNNENMLLSR